MKVRSLCSDFFCFLFVTTTLSDVIYLLGGRHTPFQTNYKPQFFFRTADITGSITLPQGTPVAMPGEDITATCDLIANVPMHEGLRFSIREGGRTVGKGVVSKIVE